MDIIRCMIESTEMVLVDVIIGWIEGHVLVLVVAADETVCEVVTVEIRIDREAERRTVVEERLSVNWYRR